ncbi:outer membrane efflux protein [Bacteroidales bacterium KA00344]|nr:outer membrane efflux protein [Bacteroidales bacterium KA00344]
MRKVPLIILLFTSLTATHAQRVLSLDSCRALALHNNKQINISRLQQDVAMNAKKAMRTNYLPKVDVLGGYQYMSRETSVLNNTLKSTISNLGTTGMQHLGSALSGISSQITELVQQGVISAQQAQQLGALMQKIGNGPIAQHIGAVGNSIGEKIVDAFRTDTRNIFAGSIMLRQPIYMGGAITAANRMADISEQMADDDLNLKTQATLYDIDQAYWTVVSLRQKQKLAISYRDLVKKLNGDVHKMIKEGVATRADGLKVDVKVNEADMQITQVDDGLSLAKMLLCQLCGLPMNEEIVLLDEESENLNASAIQASTYIPDSTLSSRPEIRLLQNTVELSKENTKLVRSAYLPHVALTGGYMVTNPNMFNGFQKKFSGVWNVGVLIQVPIWNWFESSYKIRASKSASNIAKMQLSEAQEKINLQIAQSRYKVSEAQKRLAMAEKNIISAEENLRCAQVGFREGVMETTDVMAAQTAWQKAQSQKIDAEVDVKLSNVNLQKALGILN